MATKLTLSINADVIESAKRVSRKRGKSLSRLVEEYLCTLNQMDAQKESVVDRMTSRIKGKIKIPIPSNYKEFIREERFKDFQAKRRASEK